MAERLDERLRQGRFDELQIVAAPRFLGLLRKTLSPAVLSTVTRQIDKDLINTPNEELARRLESDRLIDRRRRNCRKRRRRAAVAPLHPCGSAT